jgi:Papain family cysteine protease
MWSAAMVMAAVATAQGIPSTWDWCAKSGVCPPIGNGGECAGSVIPVSYALSAAASISAGKQIDFGSSELLKCAWKNACTGGNPDALFQYSENPGMCPTFSACGSCSTARITFTWETVAADNDTALVASIYEGPTLVMVDASTPTFQMYSGGILASKCPDQVDTFLVATAYGSTSGVCFTTSANDWGQSWGMNGFIDLARTCNGTSTAYGPHGECGINTAPSRPVVATGSLSSL